jgi:hypothetical protein
MLRVQADQECETAFATKLLFGSVDCIEKGVTIEQVKAIK